MVRKKSTLPPPEMAVCVCCAAETCQCMCVCPPSPQEMNKYLASLPVHNDIPKIAAAGLG